MHDVTHVAATVEPGLRGAVMVGQVFGESLALGLGVPFLPVNHLAGHIASVAIDNKVEFPFLSLLVSGGHTSLYRVRAWDKIELLCATMDDACGEAFDKVAKILGLEYPGGVKIEQLAKKWTGELVTFVKPSKLTAFSYSGLKTAAARIAPKLPLEQACASFQHEAVMQLVNRSVGYMKKLGVKHLAVCGGVSANGYLRQKMTEAVSMIGGSVIFPNIQYCTDNAAMVGSAAALGAKV